MNFQPNKTKIVCTIGPASRAPETLEQMILAGMNVARLNFSHGEFQEHARVIEAIRAAAGKVGRRVAIMADLPGPKIRIGRLAREPVELRAGASFILTTDDVAGDEERVSVTFQRLPHAVHPGDTLYLDDGLIQLEVLGVEEKDVRCVVRVGGPLRSRKGLNLPGIDLGISAFTPHDRVCLAFALEHGVDAVSQSFVAAAEDVEAVREAARSLGHSPFVIAKIERAGALERFDEIVEAADGIMVARGDLGVEIPIEEIAVVQKGLMEKANRLGKPVITATQMLESMAANRRPTRAEATDVANAILDGTDCVMLSGESATGKYPVEAVSMLAGIAAAIEPHRARYRPPGGLRTFGHDGNVTLVDLIALSVEHTLERISPAAVFVPTDSGATARNVTRFRLPVWIIAVSIHESTCRELQFSYGTWPVHHAEYPEDWRGYAGAWLKAHGVEGSLVLLIEGPSPKHPDGNNRMEIIDLERDVGSVGRPAG